MVKRFSNLAKSKIEFARKITEQRMSNCLSDSSPDLEDEIVTLYSTLVDEDDFKLENDEIQPEEDFLKSVEEKLIEKGETPHERGRLNKVRNKILEKVKVKKVARIQSRKRMDSIGSISSIGSQGTKRANRDQGGVESARPKTDFGSSLPLPVNKI